MLSLLILKADESMAYKLMNRKNTAVTTKIQQIQEKALIKLTLGRLWHHQNLKNRACRPLKRGILQRRRREFLSNLQQVKYPLKNQKTLAVK
jgi:hypothetical protein